MSHQDLKREKLKAILIQPETLPVQNHAFCALSGDRSPKSKAEGLFTFLQSYIRKNGFIYNLIRRVVAPACYTQQYYNEVNRMLNTYGPEAIILNLGSGPAVFQGRIDIINVDIFAFDEVDICAEASRLPLKDNTVDLILNIGLLEHVEAPAAVTAEMWRVLKSGGEALIYAPFMYPIHGAPYDYQRFTDRGLYTLVSAFSRKEVRAASGATSSMLAMWQEWMATLLSFGNKTLHDIILILLMITTFPVKYFDKIVGYFPTALSAGGYYAVVRK